CLVFFFQAEDGIRDRNVTGVQTCALPIFIFLAEDSRAVAGVARFWTCRSQRYSRPIPGALGIRREKSGPLPAVGRDRRSPTGPGRSPRSPLRFPPPPVILYLWSCSAPENDHRYKITGMEGWRRGGTVHLGEDRGERVDCAGP